MLEHLIALLAAFVIAAISSLGLFGVVLMMAIESACIPLPSEIIMPFAGYLVSIGQMNLFLVATAGAIGCNLGSAAAYAVGQYGGRPFVERWGGYILITRRDLDWADRFFARFGSAAVSQVVAAVSTPVEPSASVFTRRFGVSAVWRVRKLKPKVSTVDQNTASVGE